MNELYLIGEIISGFESEGFVEVVPYSYFPERFFDLENVFIDVFGVKKEFIIDEVDFLGRKVIVKFRNFDSADDVKFLKGKKIFIDSNSVIQLPENTFFIHDLIGARVFFDNKFFGKLIDVYSLPANDVYVMHLNDGRELLIPALKSYIDRFDPDEKILFLKELPNYDEN